MIHTTTEVRVRYPETDLMGIAHHTVFAIWIEMGRIDLLTQKGLPLKELEADGFYIPVLEYSLQLKQPAYFDDMLTIQSWMEHKPRVKFRIDNAIYRGQTLLATGHSIHAFVNKSMQAVKPPAKFLQLFESTCTT